MMSRECLDRFVDEFVRICFIFILIYVHRLLASSIVISSMLSWKARYPIRRFHVALSPAAIDRSCTPVDLALRAIHALDAVPEGRIALAALIHEGPAKGKNTGDLLVWARAFGRL